MGMTPLEGLVMGTRCGDIDPGVVLHLMRSGGYDLDAVERLLTNESGLKGLTGTYDLRAIESRAAEGDEACRLAVALYAHRARKYVGAYAVVMGGVDVIAFTGGVGENSAVMRHRIAQRLEFLGAVLDEDLNRAAQGKRPQPDDGDLRHAIQGAPLRGTRRRGDTHRRGSRRPAGRGV